MNRSISLQGLQSQDSKPWTLALGLGHVYDVGDRADPVLAALLKRLREERSLTQEQIAFDAGITASALSRIERGINQPGWTTVIQIARALDIGLAELATDYELAAGEQRTKAPG